MCGIAGSLNARGACADTAVVARMLARLTHRGPDAEGSYVDGPVALAHRRLAILDLEGGQQPMRTSNGRLAITFNGEIYNFQELRDALQAEGCHFASQGDTEIILQLYQRHGIAGLSRLRGMYAFALWDRPAQRLLLGRDRIGKKPLFYATAGGQFVFASELQALLAHPAIARDLAPEALDAYLSYGYVPAPGTIFRNVFKLLPGHYLVAQLGAGGSGPLSLATQPYWSLPYTPKLQLSEADAVEGLLEVLTEAVRLRMIADVPVGALLSGGTDSSVVVALMSQMSSRPVRTFSIGFEEHAFNELPFARMVARRYGTEHHELIVRPQLLDILPTLVRHYGEPFADSSAVPTYYVAQLTRQHVTVALNGDGGDESLGGYERYLGSSLAERYRGLPALLRQGVIEPAARLLPQGLSRWSRLRQAQRFVAAAGEPRAPRYRRWMSYFTAADKQQLYSAAFQTTLGAGEDWLLEVLESHNHGSLEALDTLLATDVTSYLPNDLLVKMDIASMAHSLEARSPFLDHKVMEFCARLPVDLKIRGANQKYLLKKLAARLLPPAVFERRKMGFGVPVGRWMRQQHRGFVEATLLSPKALGRGYFRADRLRRLVAEHMTGGQDHAPQLWSLLWLELWHQSFID